jgi:predicted XRE-type DNA-binding protein
MKWFRKPPKAPNSMAPASTSDPKINVELQALTKTRNMCAVTMASAVSFAQSSYDDLAKGERQRFESAKRMSLELAKDTTDVSYRDAALQHIVELCMKANDIKTARILVRGIQTGMIREKLLEEYPVIFY